MGRSGWAWMVATALASGCLQAPPSGSDPADGDGGLPDDKDGGGDGNVTFPPAGAAVRVSAAERADIDGDGRDDLIVLDDNEDDDWVGIYVLWAGEGGWRDVDSIQLDVRPSAVRFGSLIRPTGSALVVGGYGGKVAIVDYLDENFTVTSLTLAPAPTTRIRLLHTGVSLGTDETASLVFDDGNGLWGTTPITDQEPMGVALVTSNLVVDAAFWPLAGGQPSNFVASRAPAKIEWFGEGNSGDAIPTGSAALANFAFLVNGMCGTHIVVGDDASLSVGWIDCGSPTSGIDPLMGSDLDQVMVTAAGEFGGTTARDVALLGLMGDDVHAQVLIDLSYDDNTPAFVPDSTTELLPVPLVPGLVQLLAVDVEGDGKTFLYAVGPLGGVYCARVVGQGFADCPAEWQIKGP